MLNFISGISSRLPALTKNFNNFTPVRFKYGMKSRGALSNRIIRTSSGGLVRKKCGTNHGNGRFCVSSLKHLRKVVPITQKTYLKKYLQAVKA
ncbi:hypothetical protein PVL30_001336 [Lodderomyces elongisporus]|uniref:uncharacterized protein n=1 Tax=Lodderomyces elongisporus TaxID=36914 RepID=UPI00292737EC|nr:uncharacterized protein PVL30_001336 [Lodderomyces elongisporus]WLF77620.1 hypothetical protein PVL30_001336 [Lodderomyces elongisporus]